MILATMRTFNGRLIRTLQSPGVVTLLRSVVTCAEATAQCISSTVFGYMIQRLTPGASSERWQVGATKVIPTYQMNCTGELLTSDNLEMWGLGNRTSISDVV